MAEGIEANLPETLSPITWLRDFCTATEKLVPDISTNYTISMTKQLDPNLDYNTVSQSLRVWHALKRPEKPAQITRGTAFQATFMDEGPENEATDQESQRIERSRKRARASTTASLGPLASTRKKEPKLTYPACDGRHELSKCWLAFEEIRLKDRTMSKARLEKLAKRLESDKDLADQIRRIKEEMIDEA